MIKEAIEKVQELVKQGVPAQPITLGDKRGLLVDGKIHWESTSLPETIAFQTLQGLASFIESNRDSEFLTGEPFVHVASHSHVFYLGEADQPHARRCTLAEAKPASFDRFPFGQFMDGEEFMIKLQALFVQSVGDWASVVEACAGIKKHDGVEYKDSGITQTVAAQSGLSLSTMRKLPNPVQLAPFRTFPEIEQPISQFVLRVTDGNRGPQLALFEADGGAWKVAAVNSIKAWIQQQLPDVTVLA